MAKRKTERRSRQSAGTVPRRRPVSVGAVGGAAGPGAVWLYGIHAVLAALANPDRRVRRVLALPELAVRVRRAAPAATLPAAALIETGRTEIDRRLPAGAVHQGLAAEVEPLPSLGVEDAMRLASAREHGLVVVLDQVSDPQNVGAVLRSATAFGASAVIVPEHGSPEATGALAKAAAGALEVMPLVRVVNLRRALETLKGGGFWCLGLAGEATAAIADHDMRGRTALVLGAEGEGLRRLTRETCDLLVRVPIRGEMESLNVAAAAAVTLYEWARQTRVGPPSGG